MGAGEIGYVVGVFLASLVLPVIVLVVCNFIAGAKRNPKIVYGVCVVLAVATCLVSAGGGNGVLDALLAATLSVAFLGWGYVRAARAINGVKADRSAA